MTVVGALLAFFVTVLFMFALRPVAAAAGFVDVPGGRKRHGAAVPVIGGAAMAVGLGIGSSLVGHPQFWNPTVLAVYLLVVVGIIDDRFDLPPTVRLIAQMCASLIVVFGAGVRVGYLGTPFFFSLSLGAFGGIFSVLFIMTVINAFNIIDGIDGLAGGLALLSLVATAIIGADTETFVLSLLMSAVVAAYLLFNLPLGFNRSVRTFMGDAGSTFLGFGIAVIGIGLCRGGAPRMAPVIGLWLIAVPVFDLFSAVMRRLVEGKSPFSPDHEHLHHVLMVNGLPARATLAFMLALAAVFAATGVLGDLYKVSDGFMCCGWIAAGAAYYQIMRRPQRVVRCVLRLRPLRAEAE